MAGPKKLNTYCGILSAQQVCDGINAALGNGKRLADDAKLLLENRRFATAASLSILAIEELSKPAMLLMVALARNESEAQTHWREYRTHVKKTARIGFLARVAKGTKGLDAFLEDDSENCGLWDQIKQLGIYTDCVDNVRWALPDKLIPESLASNLVRIACEIAERERLVDIRDIDSWITHMQGPFWKPSREGLKTAVMEYCTSTRGQGFADAISQLFAFDESSMLAQLDSARNMPNCVS